MYQKIIGLKDFYVICIKSLHFTLQFFRFKPSCLVNLYDEVDFTSF